MASLGLNRQDNCVAESCVPIEIGAIIYRVWVIGNRIATRLSWRMYMYIHVYECTHIHTYTSRCECTANNMRFMQPAVIGKIWQWRKRERETRARFIYLSCSCESDWKIWCEFRSLFARITRPVRAGIISKYIKERECVLACKRCGNRCSNWRR